MTTRDRRNQLSSLTGARQTMSSWAKVVEGWEDVPEVFRKPFSVVAGERSNLPYTVFAPIIVDASVKITGRKSTEKLLCELGETIYVWERSGDEVVMAAYPVKAISDLEVGEILLYSWLAIGGVTEDGMLRSSLIEFNQSTARHFGPFLKRLRPEPKDVKERERNAEEAKLNYLGLTNLKFRNFALESLVSGEKIVQTLWQPTIAQPIVRVGGHALWRTIVSLQHLVMLTDQELIIIQDDERSKEIRGVRYGGKRQYIALRHIRAVELEDDGGDLLRLKLTLAPGGQQMAILLSASKKPEIAQLEGELAKRMG